MKESLTVMSVLVDPAITSTMIRWHFDNRWNGKHWRLEQFDLGKGRTERIGLCVDKSEHSLMGLNKVDAFSDS